MPSDCNTSYFNFWSSLFHDDESNSCVARCTLVAWFHSHAGWIGCLSFILILSWKITPFFFKLCVGGRTFCVLETPYLALSSHYNSCVRMRSIRSPLRHCLLYSTNRPMATTCTDAVAVHHFFHKWEIHKSQIFFNSTHCYGLINLKPIVPGILRSMAVEWVHDYDWSRWVSSKAGWYYRTVCMI